MMLEKLELAGFKIGRLTVIRESGKNKFGQITWECNCECGGSVKLIATVINKGRTLSCGCLWDEMLLKRNTKHGGYRSIEYSSYRSMLTRCTDVNCHAYILYGGAGIKVCDRWLHSFDNFLADMWPRPSTDYTLDRFPNMRGNYEPENCRWATISQQNRNRKTTKLNPEAAIIIRSSKLTRMELAKMFNCSRRTITQVINNHTWL
jgi:hypothetical protein